MDDILVVTHPDPIRLEARPIEHEAVPEDHIALGFFAGANLIARGVVQPNVLEPLAELLSRPVTIALAASEDAQRNIEGRICIVLPMPQEESAPESAEPWKASIPPVPPGIDSAEEPADAAPRLVLLPIGNVVRSASNRSHEDLTDDAREMLENLLSGRGQDAVSKAIDDLLRGI